MNTANTILIVDDSDDDAVLLKLALQKAGVVNPTMVVQNGAEAVSYFKGEAAFADRERFPLPSILLLDLKMPGFDGFELMDWLQQQPDRKSTLIFIVAGDWEMRGLDRAYRMGAHYFLIKPCKPQDVINLVKSFPGPWMISPPALIQNRTEK